MNRLARRLDALECKRGAALPLIVICGADPVPENAADRLVVRVDRDVGCRKAREFPERV